MGGIVQTSPDTGGGGGGFPVTAFRFVVSDASGDASALPEITAAVPFYSVNTGHPAVNANFTYHDDSNQLIVGGTSPSVSVQGTSGISQLSVFDLGATEAVLSLQCNALQMSLAIDPAGNTTLESNNGPLLMGAANKDVSIGDITNNKLLIVKATTGNVLINKATDNGVDQLQITGTIFSFNSAAPVGLHMSVGGVLANVIEDAAGNLNLSNSANANGIVLSVGGRALINTLTDDGTNTLQVNGSIKASSVTIPGLTATRVPFAGSGGTLTDSPSFIFSATGSNSGPILTIGSGITTSVGMKIGYSGTSGFGALYGSGVTPSSTNYALSISQSNSNTTVSSTSLVQLNIAGSNTIQFNGTTFVPTTTNAISLGDSTRGFSSIFSSNATFAFRTTTSLTNNAAAQIATLTNGPTAGNPTKWIAVDDNGTTRFSPLW